MATKAVLVGEDSFDFHRISEKGPKLVEAVGDCAEVAITSDLDVLENLWDYDLVIDYLTVSELIEPQLNGLLTFVREGGSYLGVHCAADLTSTYPSDPNELIEAREDPIQELHTLLGGRFIDHPEQAEFGVTIEHDHPVTEEVENFRVFDEPYQVAVNDSVTVLAQMDHPDLDPYPVVWVRSEGTGRICYISLGHTDEALRHETVRQLMRNAVVWMSESTHS